MVNQLQSPLVLLPSLLLLATTTLRLNLSERVNLVELGVYVSDIRAHSGPILHVLPSHPTETYPVEGAKLFSTTVTLLTMLTGIALRPSD
ncbi:BTE_collapsed_G0027980.mRNA.1.CDS.1 [Saccharomyces cerevisiae]|nr:BTE_collapsed_G0027980.mRNA.1.CDS.1 [Saccharomyces cerevisiae]